MRHFPLLFIALATLTLAVPVAAQDRAFQQCRGYLFSTEEDFVSRVGEARDGNPIISDGDLLAMDPSSGTASICARNAELLPPGTLVEVDQALGLDAVDAILPEEGLIAFSTELDEQFGLFGHGDILFPTGIVIPNAVLVSRFQLPDNMGLDALHFVGDLGAIQTAIRLARDIGRDRLAEDPSTYLNRLEALGVDIWFSLEGTSDPVRDPNILDGDLLSAVSGSIVAPNSTLLSPPIPAGIIPRGVDFGLDAVVTDREGNRERIRLSTEILYRGDPAPFTDGDILRIGGAIDGPHQNLIAPFNPRARFLGLDALSFTSRIEIGMNPHLDSLCGRLRSAADFSPDGLWRADTFATPPGNPPRRPCGLWIPIDGTLPPNLAAADGTIARFRVAYESITMAGFNGEIQTSWRLRKPTGPAWAPCVWQPVTENLSTDANGWMDAQDFVDALVGNPTGITGNGSLGCANPHLHLAVWASQSLPADRQNDLMRVRLEWELTDTTVVPATVAHNIQLDNILPEIPAYPGGFEVRLMDGVTQVPACGEAPSGESVFQVWADFADRHYWFFTLTVEGGDPPTTHAFASPSGDNRHEYFETPDDATVPLKNTDDTGTIPDGSLVHLRNIDMTELGESFQRCCYLLEIRVYDAAIRHSFSGFTPSTSLGLNDTRRITTFEAGS